MSELLDKRLEFIPNVYHLPNISQRIGPRGWFVFYDGNRYGEPNGAPIDVNSI